VRGQRFFRSVFTMPIFTAPIALGYLGLTIFHEEVGAVNTVLRALGMVHLPAWFSNAWLARMSIVLVDIWQWTPFCFLIFLAALQGIPEDFYEAARLETRSAWRVFRHITLPILKPTIVLVLLLRITDAFKVFDIPFTLTGGGPGTATQVLTMYAHRQGMRFFNHGYAASIAILLFLLVMGIILTLFKRLREAYR